MTLCGDWLVRGLATLWYRLDRRHRGIPWPTWDFAYGACLTPEGRESLARRVFRHFVRFAWEPCELLWRPCRNRPKVIILGRGTQAALAQGRGDVAIAADAGTGNTPSWATDCNAGPVAVVGRELDHAWAGSWPGIACASGAATTWCPNKRASRKSGTPAGQTGWWGLSSTRTPPPRAGSPGGLFRPRRPAPPRWRRILARRGVPVLPMLSRRLPDGRHLMVILPPLPHEKPPTPRPTSSATWNSRAGSSRPGFGAARNSGSGSTGAGKTSFRRFITAEGRVGGGGRAEAPTELFKAVIHEPLAHP